MSSSAGQLAASSRVYFIANVLVMLASFISMPLMTRLLSQAEYGTLNLVLATFSILAGIAQFGFPQATLRFYADRRAQGRTTLRAFCDSMIGGALAASVSVAILVVVATSWLGTSGSEYVACLRAGALLIVIRVLMSVVYELYRVEDRTLLYFAAQVVSRYGTLALVVALLVLRQPTARQVTLATAIGEGTLALLCFGELLMRGSFTRPRLSSELVRAAMAYGVPMVAVGLASFLMDYADRFLIEAYLGAPAVARYAVPYDLAQALVAFTCAPVRLALIPVLFRLWSEEGGASTSRLASQVLTYVLAVLIPISALFILLNREVITLLASQKYADSTYLTPYLIPGVILGELNFVIAVGLAIEKSTVALAVITFASAVLNAALNVLLLPTWGLRGAGIATTIAFAVMVGATYSQGRRVLPLRPDAILLAKVLMATALMVAALLVIGPVASWQVADLAVRGTLGVTIAATCLALLDPPLFRMAWAQIRGGGVAAAEHALERTT